jgi:hypothetical protein
MAREAEAIDASALTIQPYRPSSSPTRRCSGLPFAPAMTAANAGPSAPMVIALPNGRVNRIPQTFENHCETWVLAIARLPASGARSRSIHRDI